VVQLLKLRHYSKAVFRAHPFDLSGSLVFVSANISRLPMISLSANIERRYHRGVWLNWGIPLQLLDCRHGIVQKYTHDGSKMLLQIGTKGVMDSADGTPTAGA